jgi:hypothetical protein
MIKKKFRSMQEFYPFYLSEHRNFANRVLHFVGSGLALLSLLAALLFHNFNFFIAIPILLYGFAAIGHLFFEKNRPATFRYPVYGLAGDFKLFFDLLSGNQPFRSN